MVGASPRIYRYLFTKKQDVKNLVSNVLQVECDMVRETVEIKALFMLQSRCSWAMVQTVTHTPDRN